ncbi:MAG: hypothetical protein LBD23_19075 [Oscillospiraceae bacterium]|jgi:hypothetical protein|nr:hypothetical protein [Oscillospiraceae bacterium]
MDLKDIIVVILSSLALCVSIFTFLFHLKNKKRDYAPLLIAEKEVLNDFFVPISDNILEKYIFTNNKLSSISIDNILDEPKLILDNRAFIRITEVNKDKNLDEIVANYLKGANDENFVTCNSLILDTRSKKQKVNLKSETPIATYNFCTITLRNAGFDLQKLKINKVRFVYKKSFKSLTLKPTDHNSLNVYVGRNGTVDLGISMISYDNDYKLFDENFFTPEFMLIKKLLAMGTCKSENNNFEGNLFNVTLPSSPDLFSHLECYMTVYNSFNKKYKQKIIVISRDCKYLTYTFQNHRVINYNSIYRKIKSKLKGNKDY